MDEGVKMYEDGRAEDFIGHCAACFYKCPEKRDYSKGQFPRGGYLEDEAKSGGRGVVVIGQNPGRAHDLFEIPEFTRGNGLSLRDLRIRDRDLSVRFFKAVPYYVTIRRFLSLLGESGPIWWTEVIKCQKPPIPQLPSKPKLPPHSGTRNDDEKWERDLKQWEDEFEGEKGKAFLKQKKKEMECQFQKAASVCINSVKHELRSFRDWPILVIGKETREWILQDSEMLPLLQGRSWVLCLPHATGTQDVQWALNVLDGDGESPNLAQRIVNDIKRHCTHGHIPCLDANAAMVLGYPTAEMVHGTIRELEQDPKSDGSAFDYIGRLAKQSRRDRVVYLQLEGESPKAAKAVEAVFRRPEHPLIPVVWPDGENGYFWVSPWLAMAVGIWL